MKLNIANKLNFLIIFLQVIFFILLGIYFIENQKKILNSEMHKRINALISNSSINSEYPVLIKDVDVISKLVKNILEQEDIIYCSIEDKNGIVLYEEGSKNENNTEVFISTINTYKKFKGEVFFLDIDKDKSVKEKIGKILIITTLKNLKQKINNIKKTIFFIIMFCIILTSLASSLLLKIILDKPIKQLALGTEIIASGNLDYKVIVKTNDELGRLAVDFNKMTKDLQYVMVSKNYVDNIIKSMIDALIVVNPDGKIKTVNNATLDLLGYTEPELVGNPKDILFTKFENSKWNELLEKGMIRNYEINLITKKKEKFQVNFSGSVIKDNNNNVTGIVIVIRDMREIKKLQNQIIQSEKMSAIGQLAGGIAHEINNPMGVILGFAQSIIMRFKEGDTLYMPLKSIEREAIRCKKLVGDMLTFSRKEKTENETTDINKIIDETLSLIEGQTKVKSIDLIKEYGINLPLITINKNQIQQVIVNLCNNAIDALPKGGKIIISTQTIIVSEMKKSDIEIITDTPHHDLIKIEITDTGTGMSEEIKKHIFEAFFTTKEAGKGTGLGLSLCYEIINKHNGTIEVESEIGKGTKFIIKLPVIKR